MFSILVDELCIVKYTLYICCKLGCVSKSKDNWIPFLSLVWWSFYIWWQTRTAFKPKAQIWFNWEKIHARVIPRAVAIPIPCHNIIKGNKWQISRSEIGVKVPKSLFRTCGALRAQAFVNTEPTKSWKTKFGAFPSVNSRIFVSSYVHSPCTVWAFTIFYFETCWIYFLSASLCSSLWLAKVLKVHAPQKKDMWMNEFLATIQNLNNKHVPSVRCEFW